MIRILYVDDEPDLRELAAMSLELDPEFEVRTCASGADAIAAVPAFDPALVLLDVMMPGMDGPAVLKALRDSHGTRLRIVFITARAGLADRQALLQLGVDGVIAKPFDPMALADNVRAFLP